MMKKKVMWIIFIVVAITLIWYKIPVYKHRTFEGVLFQLGAENAHVVQPVEVEIKGVFKRYFFKPRVFEGTMRIGDERLPPPGSREEKLRINLGNMWDSMIRAYDVDEHIYFYGLLTVNHTVSKLAIAVNEQLEDFRTHWSSEDGMVIAAPATNREEALAIADELIRPYLWHPDKKPLE
jgi:hypothetical protein